MTTRRPSKRAGASWRVLAHDFNGNRVLDKQSEDNAIRHAARARKLGMKVLKRGTTNAGRSIFDELVIDDWFHLEQMDDRQWCLVLGNQVWLSLLIQRDGTARIIVTGGAEHIEGIR